MMGRHQRGSSLIELLVALFVGTLVAGGAFLCVLQFQKTADLLTNLLDRDGSLIVAPLLLERWIGPAGCHLDEAAQGVDLSESVLRVRADFNGPDGLPDGALDSSFESIEIRSSGSSLQLRSGSGNFQPVLNFVTTARFALESESLIRIDLRLASSAKVGPDPPALERPFLVHLWNRWPQLFKE